MKIDRINKNPKTITALLVFSVALNLVFLYTILVGNGSSEENIIDTKLEENLFSSNYNENEERTTQASEGFKVYVNEEANYSIEFPEEWNISNGVGGEAAGDDQYVILTKTDVNIIPYISIDTQIDTREKCLEVYDHSRSAGVVSFETKNSNVGDTEFVTSKAVFDDDSMDYHETLVTYQHWNGSKDRCYKITTHDSLGEDYKEDLEEILLSFKFI